MLYRISVTLLSLLKKDQYGIRKYVYVKEHIAQNKHAVAGFVTSVFLFALLTYVSITSSERLDIIRRMTIEKASYIARISELEENLFKSTISNQVMASKCNKKTSGKQPGKIPSDNTRRVFITRELVIEKLSRINN